MANFLQGALLVKADILGQLIDENEDLHQQYDANRQAQAEKIAELHANLNEAVSQAVLKPRFVASPETLANPNRLFVFATNIYSEDQEQADAFFHLAAEKGHTEAMLHLGTQKWLEVAATKNNTKAMIRLANLYKEEGNREARVGSREWLERITNSKDLFMLANLWIVKAAKLGDQEAVGLLALIPAEELYRAARHYEDSEWLAGFRNKKYMLELGEIFKDMRSYHWIEKAAELGDKKAIEILASIPPDALGGEPIHDNYVLDLYEAAAEKGDPLAQIAICYKMYYGDGMVANRKKAKELCEDLVGFRIGNGYFDIIKGYGIVYKGNQTPKRGVSHLAKLWIHGNCSIHHGKLKIHKGANVCVVQAHPNWHPGVSDFPRGESKGVNYSGIPFDGHVCITYLSYVYFRPDLEGKHFTTSGLLQEDLTIEDPYVIL